MIFRRHARLLLWKKRPYRQARAGTTGPFGKVEGIKPPKITMPCEAKGCLPLPAGGHLLSRPKIYDTTVQRVTRFGAGTKPPAGGDRGLGSELEPDRTGPGRHGGLHGGPDANGTFGVAAC